MQAISNNTLNLASLDVAALIANRPGAVFINDAQQFNKENTPKMPVSATECVTISLGKTHYQVFRLYFLC